MSESTPDIDRDVRAAWNSSAPVDQWIVEINAAEGYLIVTDERDRSFARVPVLVGEAIEFGTPVRVLPGYVDVPVAASRVVFASREESRPTVEASTPPREDSPTEPAVDPVPAGPEPDPVPVTEPEPQTPPQLGGVPISPGAEPEQVSPETTKEDHVSLSEDMRSRLGLADDADEAAALAAIDALKQKADNPQPDPETVAASAAAVKERDELQKEVAVLASQMQSVTAELAAVKAKEAATIKASVLDAAQAAGKFAPAERKQWESDYDEAPGAVTRILASIAAGTAVPVLASGYTGTGEETGDVDSEYERLVAQIDGPHAVKGA